MSALEPRISYERAFDARYGLEAVGDGRVDGDGVARARLPVRDDVRDHAGRLPGGVLAAAAEAVASLATARAVAPRAASGLSNDTTAFTPVTGDVVHVEARVEACADDAWLWTVRHRDDAGALCGLSRVTVAVR